MAGMAQELHKTARAILAELKPNFKFEKDKRLFNAGFPAACTKLKNQGLNFLYQLYILREYFVCLVAPKDFLTWLIFAARLKTGQAASLPVLAAAGAVLGTRPRAGPKAAPTRFGADQMGLIRNNSPNTPGPRHGRQAKSGGH